MTVFIHLCTFYIRSCTNTEKTHKNRHTPAQKNTLKLTHTHIYIYIYMCVCVYIYIYIYIYIKIHLVKRGNLGKVQRTRKVISKRPKIHPITLKIYVYLYTRVYMYNGEHTHPHPENTCIYVENYIKSIQKK